MRSKTEKFSVCKNAYRNCNNNGRANQKARDIRVDVREFIPNAQTGPKANRGERKRENNLGYGEIVPACELGDQLPSFRGDIRRSTHHVPDSHTSSKNFESASDSREYKDRC